MKCWIVPSSLFVPGRLMAPVHITQELKQLQDRKKRLEDQLAKLPAEIHELEVELAAISKEFEPYKLKES